MAMMMMMVVVMVMVVMVVVMMPVLIGARMGRGDQRSRCDGEAESENC
jgi:uncharacterized membrane protein